MVGCSNAPTFPFDTVPLLCRSYDNMWAEKEEIVQSDDGEYLYQYVYFIRLVRRPDRIGETKTMYVLACIDTQDANAFCLSICVVAK